MILISIIIPVYKSSKFLRRCFDSVINQTLKDIEIIIVNDCSPDPLDDEICKEYLKTDSRITYITHEKNIKQGGARNTALDIAKGQYIWFIDSDDFVSYTACELLFNIAKKNNLEIVGFESTHVQYEEGKIIPILSDESLVFKRYHNLIYKITDGYQSLVIQDLACPPFYLFHRDLFKHKRFPVGVYHEDTDFIPTVILEAKRMMVMDVQLYFRTLHSNSTTGQKVHYKLIYDKFLVLERLINYIIANNFYAIPDHPLITSFLTEFERITIYGTKHDKILTEQERVDVNNITNNIEKNMQMYLGSLVDNYKERPKSLFVDEDVVAKNNALMHEINTVKNEFWYQFALKNKREKIKSLIKRLLQKLKH